MKKTLFTIGLAVFLVSGATNARAESSDEEVIVMTSESGADQAGDRDVYDSPINFSLDGGILSFQEPDSAGEAVDSLDDDRRFLTGIRATWDFADLGSDSPIRIGVGTGLLYSRLGDTSSSSGSNFFMLPANLTLGATIGGNFLLAAHGGGNVVYRDDPGAVGLGRDDRWEIFPAVGAELGVGFGGDIGLSLRGDYTLTPGDNLLAATLGLVFGVG